MEKIRKKVIGENNYSDVVKKILITAVVLVMVGIPFFNLFKNGGAYAWPIRQKAFYLSGIQCIVFVLLVFFLSILRREKAAIIIIGFSALFMVMQGVILPFITAYVYFEMISFIGFAINQRAGRKDDIMLNFLVGLSIWGAMAILCSLLKFGTINDLRIMTILMVIVLFFFSKERYETMIGRLANYIEQNKEYNLNLLLIIAIITISLVLAVKTNSGQDFDSLWYMLKPEGMLVGENSFYDYLGYAAFVFYYPKLVELFCLPLGGLGDHSFILIASVFIYALFVVLTYKVLTLLCPKCKEHIKLCFLMVLFSVPAITGIASSAKGDISGGFLVMAGIWFFIQFLQGEEIYHIVLAVVMLLLSTGTKLTYLLWGGIVGIVISIYFVYWLVKNRKNISCKKFSVYNILVPVSGVFFIAGIHFRTYLLTGYPIYPLLLGLWNKLGFTANYAMKMTSDTRPSIAVEQMANRGYTFFFDPSSLSNVVMCWPTNIVLIFIIIAIILLVGKKMLLNTTAKLLLIIATLQMVFAIYYIFTTALIDGNYFYFPFLLICIVVFYIINLQQELLTKFVNTKFIIVIFSLMLIVTLPLTFVTNVSWSLGISPLTSQVIGENFSDYKNAENRAKQNGYYNIEKYIKEEFGNGRIIASGNDVFMAGAIETYEGVFSSWFSSAEITASYENFLNYIQYANIKGFVLANNDETIFKDYVIRMFEEGKCVKSIEDSNAIFYSIY